MTRTSLLRSALAIGLALVDHLPVRAQDQAESYPTRPIRIIVGFAPGGSTDAPVQVLAQQASKTLKQAIVIENKPGVGGTLAAQSLQTAAPDGYQHQLPPGLEVRPIITLDGAHEVNEVFIGDPAD